MDYTVKQGDNLSKIASINNTTVDNLAALNSIKNPNLINVGQTIKLPSSVQTNITPTADFGALTATNQVQGGLAPAPVAPVSAAQPASYAELALNTLNETAGNQYDASQLSALDQIKRDMGLLGEKAAETNTLNQTSGVVQNRQAVADLANQILTLRNAGEADKLAVGMNAGGLTVADRQGEEGRINRENAIKALTLSSQLNAAQGKLALAQENVAAAIEAKYAPIQARVAATKDFLEQNKYFLEKADKKAFEKQQLLISAREKDLAEAKKKESEISDIILNAAKQGAPADLLSKAQKAGSAIEAAMLVKDYSKDYKVELLKAQIATEKAQANKYYTDASKTKAEINALNRPATAGPGESVASALPVTFAAGTSETTKRQLQDQYAATLSMNTELDKYKDLISKYGNTNILPAEGKSAIEGQKAIVTSLVKDAQQLGTLDTGVLTLVDQMLGGSGFGNMFIPVNATTDKIENLKQSFNTQLKNKAKVVGALISDETFSNNNQSQEDMEAERILNAKRKVEETSNKYGSYKIN